MRYAAIVIVLIGISRLSVVWFPLPKFVAQDSGIWTPVYVPLGEQNKFATLPIPEQDRWLSEKLDLLIQAVRRGPRWLAFMEQWQWLYMTITGPRELVGPVDPVWHAILDTDWDGDADLRDIAELFDGLSR